MKTVIFMVVVVISLLALKQKQTSLCFSLVLVVSLPTASSSIDKFLLEAGNAEQFDGNASIDQALEKLGLQSQYDLVSGMEVALMPHQTIGVAWMLDKEQSPLKGGCLADDMGLGKVRKLSTKLIVLFSL